MEDPLTPSELYLVLKTVKISSFPGLDYRFLKVLPEIYLETFLDIFNSLVSHGIFPDEWKQSLVILIPKPMEGNGGVYLISLLSCLLKLFEKFVYNRFQWCVKSKHLFPNTQFDFRHSWSCIDNLVIFASVWTNFAEGRSSIAVFS